MRLAVTLAKTSVSIFVFVLTVSAQQKEAGNVEARLLLRQASALIPQIEKVQQSSALANIAGRQVAAGDVEGAMATYRANAKSDNGAAVMVIAGLLASHGNLPLALDLASGADAKFQPNAYSFISTQLAMKKQFEDALAAAHMIQGQGTAHVLVNALMLINTEQLGAGDHPGAHNTLDEALDTIEQEEERARGGSGVPNVSDTPTIGYMYRNVAERLIYAGDREDALAAVERLYAFANTVEDPAQKQQVLSSLASAQAVVGQLDTALDTARQLPPGSLRDFAMESISLQKANQGDAAGALQQAALVEGGFLRNGSLRGVADNLAGAGDYQQALAAIDLIQEPGERAYGLSELALEQAQKSDPKASLTVQLASEAAYNAGDEAKPFVFEQIAVARGLLKDFAAAEELISRLQDSDKVWPLWNLTEYLVGDGRTEEAISLAESQSAPYPKAYALLGTATALIDNLHVQRP